MRNDSGVSPHLPWYGMLGRRATLLWAVVMICWYFLPVRMWIKPHILKWGLPWAGSIVPPHVPFFLGHTALFLAAICITLAAGYCAGRILAKWLRIPASATCLIALGWGFLALALLGLGLGGCWFRAVFAVVIAPLAAAGAAGLWRQWRPSGCVAGLWRFREFALPAGLLGWLLLLICLCPETFQDALRYHLFFPKRFLLEHKFILIERYFFWSYMGLPHMLYAAAMALGGDMAARAVNAAFALAVLATLARLASRAGLPWELRALALALTVTAPGFMLVTAATFSEHECFLYVQLAIELVFLTGRTRLSRLREILLLFGMAFSAKFTALFGVGGYVALLAVRPDRRDWWAALSRKPAAMVAWFAGPLIFWWAARWLWTGDPLSPHLARFGLPSLDASSSNELAIYYNFINTVQHKWLTSPDRIFSFPITLMGGPFGYWEHPGPAISALLLAALAYLGATTPEVRMLLAFSAGSAGLWVLMFGGVSPHYVIGMVGVWTVALIGVLPALDNGKRTALRNLLSLTVFVQALLTMAAGVIMFGPRDFAFGTVTKDHYLAEGMVPRQVRYPVWKELEAAFPGRGTVYILGDDTGYYLSGRVFTDYEWGSDPLLWRLASESPDPARLRVRLHQRNFTHMIYSTICLDDNMIAEIETFRFKPRTALLMQEFWREYAVPVIKREAAEKYRVNGSYAFLLRRPPGKGTYDASFSRRLPFLPGAGILTWEGDAEYRDGRLAQARRVWEEWAGSYGRLAVLEDRLARVSLAEGRPGEAREHLRRVRAAGWITDAAKKPTGELR